MIELPEAVTLAGQIQRVLTGRRIDEVEVNHTPHGMTGFHGDPAAYPVLLTGCHVTRATSWGGLVEITADDQRIVLGDGATPRLYAQGEALPAKHQLRLTLDDGASLVVSVQMYGGIQVFADSQDDNPYYRVAVAAPSPLTEAFDAVYFDQLIAGPAVRTHSTKALLATEQRIPGLGNGTLQDILWTAQVLPTRPVGSLSGDEVAALFDSVRGTLAAMTTDGGRDTERDLFGEPGGYTAVMGRRTLALPCPRCRGAVVKRAYLGGAVYFCPGCQR